MAETKAKPGVLLWDNQEGNQKWYLVSKCVLVVDEAEGTEEYFTYMEALHALADRMEEPLRETHKQSYLDGFDCDDMCAEYIHVKGRDKISKAYATVNKRLTGG